MAKNFYRDLLVWQKSVSLIKEVYAEADKLPKSEEYNLKQQLKRAVVSVSLNIAAPRYFVWVTDINKIR